MDSHDKRQGMITVGYVVAYAFLTAVFGYGIYWMRRRHQSKLLRRAIQSEIKASDIEMLQTSDLPIQYIPSDIYESNVDRLGLLSGDEIEAIIPYYAAVFRVKMASETMEQEEYDAIYSQLIDKVRSRKKVALEALP